MSIYDSSGGLVERGDSDTANSDTANSDLMAVTLCSEAAALAIVIESLPSPDPLCPFCVVLSALPFPDFATERLCEEHLPIFRALQCRGWNMSRWHQRLAALARWGKLPGHVVWWPEIPCESIR